MPRDLSKKPPQCRACGITGHSTGSKACPKSQLVVKALARAVRKLSVAANGDVRKFMDSFPVDDLTDDKACAWKWMAAVTSYKGAYQCGRSTDAREPWKCQPDHERSSPNVDVAPTVGFWDAFVEAAAKFCTEAGPPCSHYLPSPGDKAAYKKVATTTAMVVARAVPRAIKRLAGVLVADAFKVATPKATSEGLRERRGVQAHADAKVAAALSAGLYTVRDDDWPAVVLKPARKHVEKSMRDAFDMCLCMEVWADKAKKQGKVLAVALGEAQQAHYWQYFLPLLLEVQAMLAVHRQATIPVLQREHPRTCRYTRVTPQLLHWAIGKAGLDGEGWWQGVHGRLADKAADVKAEAVRALARKAEVGSRKTNYSSKVLTDGTGIVFVYSREATAAETVAEAAAHVRRGLGPKNAGGAPHSLEAQATAQDLDLGDASFRYCLVGVEPGKNGVATAYSAGLKQLFFRAAPHVHAWRREKALLLAAHAALRTALAVTLLASQEAEEDALQMALTRAEKEREALPAVSSHSRGAKRCGQRRNCRKPGAATGSQPRSERRARRQWHAS